MATVELTQPQNRSTPDVLFGDFSENEVASIIYNSTVFESKHSAICFGNFSEEEILEIINASHSTKDGVEFDFEDIEPVQKPLTNKIDTDIDADKKMEGVHEEIQINGVETAAPIPYIQAPTSILNGGLDFQNCSQSPSIMQALSTPDRTDINEVLKILIEETVKSISLTPPLQHPFPYTTQAGTWSAGNSEPVWPSPATSDFYTTPSETEQIWSKPAEPTSVWSNGTGNQWSSLFKSEKDSPIPISIHPVHPQILSENLPVSSKDRKLMMLGSQLQLMTISHHVPVNIVPRGLINKSTNCFVHAPLQALLVSPLYHVLQQVDTSYALPPVLSSIKQFFSTFNPATGVVVDKMDTPFEPSFVYEMLRNKMPNFNENGRQEDAEEFLGIILSNLHDEMVSAVRSANKTVTLEDAPILVGVEDGEWQQIGRKNKVQVTRNTSNNEPSPVSKLFGGLTRSVVSKAGTKESATLQPFLSVQLDIQHSQIDHVRDALCHFTRKEQIVVNGTKCFRREALESLPPVLILHLKRFIFDDAAKSCQKLLKDVNFDTDMTIADDMMSSVGLTTTAERRYSLFGVVYHHGSQAAGGHYSAMVYHPQIQSWVHADDDKITHQTNNAVLKHVPGRSAYLLFYKRVG